MNTNKIIYFKERVPDEILNKKTWDNEIFHVKGSKNLTIKVNKDIKLLTYEGNSEGTIQRSNNVEELLKPNYFFVPESETKFILLSCGGFKGAHRKVAYSNEYYRNPIQEELIPEHMISDYIQARLKGSEEVNFSSFVTRQAVKYAYFDTDDQPMLYLPASMNPEYKPRWVHTDGKEDSPWIPKKYFSQEEVATFLWGGFISSKP